MNDSTRFIGIISEQIKDTLHLQDSDIYMDDGLIIHIQRRHPEDQVYLADIPSILNNPDYYGISPNQDSTSFELVKKFDRNVQIGIKLDFDENYYYIATLYTITEAKLEHRLASGRLRPVQNN